MFNTQRGNTTPAHCFSVKLKEKKKAIPQHNYQLCIYSLNRDVFKT